MHENRRINPHDILMQQRHSLPPIPFDIVFQLNTVLSVIINSRQSIVNLARLEHEPVFLRVRHYLFKHIFLLCHLSVLFLVVLVYIT